MTTDKGIFIQNIYYMLSYAYQVLQQQDVKDALARANSVPSWQAPDEYRRSLDADRKLYAELLPAIGIRGN